MTTWIGLLRGINVGGNNILPMKKLTTDLESLKLKNVRTYIQSGNIVFDATAKTAKSLSKMIGDKIETEHGFRPQLLVLSCETLQDAIRLNPFPNAVSDPKSLHFLFLAEPATKADIAALDRAKAPSERFELTDKIFYLHAPDGVGRSKLAASAEKLLGVMTTGRNYRTVEKLCSMSSQ
jgi:uncharacterized protein (DUF1697 family)